MAKPDDALEAKIPESIPNNNDKIAHNINSNPILYTIFYCLTIYKYHKIEILSKWKFGKKWS